MKKTTPSPSLISFYAENEEGNRLSRSAGSLEFERTKEIIQRFAAKPPAVAIDVGGGTGPYSRWLAKEGYVVHLVEPAPNLLEKAKQLSNQEPKSQIQSYSLSDARSMPFRDRFTDIILLFGPLYHLTDKIERLKAIKEAYRVTKNGGIIFAVGISRFASFMDGFRNEYFTDPDFVSIVEEDIASGQHRNPTGKLEYFTEAYFHHPNELEREIKESGFNHLETLAVEGPAWMFDSLSKFWNDKKLKEKMLKLTRSIEKDPSILGASAHILVVGKKD